MASQFTGTGGGGGFRTWGRQACTCTHCYSTCHSQLPCLSTFTREIGRAKDQRAIVCILLAMDPSAGDFARDGDQHCIAVSSCKSLAQGSSSLQQLLPLARPVPLLSMPVFTSQGRCRLVQRHGERAASATTPAHIPLRARANFPDDRLVSWCVLRQMHLHGLGNDS